MSWKDPNEMTKEEILSEIESLKKIRKISSEITVEGLLNKVYDLSPLRDLDFTIAPNGAIYRRVNGVLPALMEKMYNERVIYKTKMIEEKKKLERLENDKNVDASIITKTKKEISRCHNIQMAKKISLNSAYGSCGNEYFRYYKLDNAKAITYSGKCVIQWIERKFNQYLNTIVKTEGVDYVIASDTDSIYLNIGPLVDLVYQGKERNEESIINFLDKVCKTKFDEFIKKSFNELGEYMNVHKQKMSMKRENIASTGIWTSKKHYILNVWDSEGVRYQHPKLKMIGIEAVKSSTPAICRKMMKETIELIVSGATENEVIDFIEQKKEQFKQMPINQISFPRSVNNIKKYHSSVSIYAKSCPVHVRGALLYNNYVKKKNLTNKYPLINSGDKIKYIYLSVPNPIHENIITYIQRFPKELELDRYIDYELQFEKSFLKPIESILNVIGWKSQKTNTLSQFLVSR